MRRRHFHHLVATCLVFVSALVAGAAHAQAPHKIGVLMLHGKNPGSNNDLNMSRLKPVLEREGMVVIYPDMPWSRGRYLDGHWDKAMAEMAAHVQTLRSQGATKIVIAGHSMGVPAAMGFAARGGDVQALVLLAPGHVPARYYASTQNKVVRESIDEARALVAAGKGDSRERFSDINQGKQLPVVATAKDYLSYFDPESDADMGVTAPRIPAATAVLTVVGDDDNIIKFARTYFVDKLPANPKSQYLEIKANHLSTPVVASDAVAQWIKTATAP
ncbi:alpha/beta fold hydrolase [Polaromonas aquatica]|uniref:alpha/beta fold hydrolase n=1 Tax=Polaromonas aquatica TaxID=332657 RepID=UPI003D654545